MVTILKIHVKKIFDHDYIADLYYLLFIKKIRESRFMRMLQEIQKCDLEESLEIDQRIAHITHFLEIEMYF